MCSVSRQEHFNMPRQEDNSCHVIRKIPDHNSSYSPISERNKIDAAGIMILETAQGHLSSEPTQPLTPDSGRSDPEC